MERQSKCEAYAWVQLRQVINEQWVGTSVNREVFPSIGAKMTALTILAGEDTQCKGRF